MEDPALRSNTFTINDAIQHIGFGKMQLRMLFFTGWCWMADAGEAMVMSFLLPAIEKEWHRGPVWTGTVGSSIFLGMLIGALVVAVVADRRGRRPAFIIICILASVFGAASAFAPSIQWLAALRMIMGIGIGGSHVPVEIFMEFLAPSTRGRMMMLLEAFWSIGTMYCIGVAWLTLRNPSIGWRGFLLASSVPMFVLSCLSPWLPESPHWLASQGRKEETLQVLQRMATENGKDMPEGELVVECDVGGNQYEPVDSDDDEERTITKSSLQLKDLIRPPLLGVMSGLGVVWFLDGLSYYGLVLMLPVYFQEKDENVFVNVLITTAAEFPGFLLATALVDRVGRIVTQTSTFFFAALCTAALIGLEAGTTVVILLAMGGRLFVFAAFSATWIVTPEMLPTNLRSRGLGICVALSRVGGLLSNYAVTIPRAKTGSYQISGILFAIACMLAAIASQLFGVETMGHPLPGTLGDVNRMLEKKKPPSPLPLVDSHTELL